MENNDIKAPVKNPISPSGIKKMKPINIVDRFEKTDPMKLPTIVLTTIEENLYIEQLINKSLTVLEENRVLQENDQEFGSGRFFWPKDPTKEPKLSISYDAPNFKLRSISVEFKRFSSESAWCSVGISVHPRNFPVGIFSMNLTRSFFAGYQLEKSLNENREDEAIKNVNIFMYTAKTKSGNVSLKFEARQDVSNLTDGFPKSFHALTIERLANDCVPSTKIGNPKRY